MPNVKMPVQGSLFGDEVGVLPEDEPPSAIRPDRIGPTAVTYTPSREILTRATGLWTPMTIRSTPTAAAPSVAPIATRRSSVGISQNRKLGATGSRSKRMPLPC